MGSQWHSNKAFMEPPTPPLPSPLDAGTARERVKVISLEALPSMVKGWVARRNSDRKPTTMTDEEISLLDLLWRGSVHQAWKVAKATHLI